MTTRNQPYNDGLGPVFAIIGGKWKALILWELHGTAVRFGSLKRRIAGISEKMLIQQLREMEADGLVHREMFHQVPPRVDYSVTPLGASLNDALTTLCEWGKLNLENGRASEQATD
jgi:DNA-binding HxlR family transcriptional regulator